MRAARPAPFVLAAALAGLAALPAVAEAPVIDCVATTQCRGDAKRMCAPSSLLIRVDRRGPGARLWIDRQGPYAARTQAGALVVEAFGPGYQLQIAPDGAFLYTGNRGKRFTGHCAEAAR